MPQKALTQKELIKRLAESMGEDIKSSEAKAIWEEVAKFLLDQLMKGEVIRINGIGTLRRKDREAKEVRIPGTDRTTTSVAKIAFKLSSKSYPK